MLKRINDSSHKVRLLRQCGVSTTFNVGDLSPYLDYVPLENLRSNSLQQGEDDRDQLIPSLALPYAPLQNN